MSQHVDPITLPTLPKSDRAQDLLDYLSKLNNAVQFFADQVVQLVNNGLIAYYTIAAAQAVTSGSLTQAETLSPALPTGSTYSVLMVPNWTTAYSITTKTLSSFNINFSVAAPSGGGVIDVFVVTRNPQ